jgi:protein tyrosine phosphatase (PTP) superfamily phosphohydrolase (DUF442 family)
MILRHLAFLLVLVAPVDAQVDPLAGDPDVPNYVRLSDQIALAGQPTDQGFKKIQKAGFATVMKFFSKEEPAKEKQMVEGLDMTYVFVPYKEITDEAVKRFSQAVSDPFNKPLFLHCGKSNIVKRLWAVHRVLHDAAPEEEAIDEVKRLGLSQSRIEQVRDYLRTKDHPVPK